MDCAIDWTGHKEAWVSVDDHGMITRVMKLKKQFPDKVEIKTMPEDNHGMLVAIVPKQWVKISPPRQISDEQRARSSELMKQRYARSSESKPGT